MLNLRRFKKISQRREALEKALGISCQNIGCYSPSLEIASTKNCENMIGVAQVPIGVAGPLRLTSVRSGQAAQHNLKFYVPLATTEGALVASVNRGCRAVSLSGGAKVLVKNIGITRGPVFKTNSLLDSFKLTNWLKTHFNDLNHLIKETSSHLELKEIKTQTLGRNVFIRFYFDTQEAMGMNMATIAVDKIVPFIERQTGSQCLSLTGNFCVDKKPAWLNFILGRGKQVWAEGLIKKEIVRKVLKTTSQKIYDIWLNKCLLGSVMSGSLGFNAHFANIIAAIFCATGQDLAQVSEGALGITTAEVEQNGDLYISVYLPDLPLGTIGGGTSLPTQKEAISIIFARKKPLVTVLAEVIGGAVLAGELSLLASLAQGSLAQAHQKLARRRKNA